MNFGGSQPLCPHLHIPESVQFQGRVGTPCVSASELPLGEHRNNPNPHNTHHHLPGCPRCLRPLRGLPVQPRITPASELPTPPPPVQTDPWPRPTVQSQALGSTRTKAPRLNCQPSRGKHTAWVGPYPLQTHPQMAAQRTQRQWPSYRPHPTPPPLISSLARARSKHEYRAISPSSVKTSQISTTYIISMEQQSIQ